MFQRVFTPFIFVSLIFTSLCYADVVEFPEEDLATESVLPIFDKKTVVRERKVKTEKRFELGGGVGLNLVEPLYEQMTFNLTGSYHFDEIHGVNLSMYILSEGLSTAGKDLQAGRGLENTGNTFDASRAPTVSSMFFGNYQFTAYYGKISVTKQSTMNLSLYGIVGAGLINWTDETGFGLDVGFGQKLYVNENLGFRLDLMLALYGGPDPTSPKGGATMTAGGAKNDSGNFDTTYYMRPFLTGSVIYLF